MRNADLKNDSSTPFLFQKRVPVTTNIAAQYIGTDMEMDPKESYVKSGVSTLTAEEI